MVWLDLASVSWLELVSAVLFAGAGLAVVVRWSRRGADRWTAGCVAATVILGLILLIGPAYFRPVRALIISDQVLSPDAPAPDLDALLERLARTRAGRVAMLAVDPTAPVTGPGPAPSPAWVESVAPDASRRLLAGSARVPSLADALSFALKAIRPHGDWREAVTDLLFGTAGRIIVGVTDRGQWRDWHPLDVDDLLANARRQEVVIDRIDLHPRPIAATVVIEAPLGLPADWALHESAVRLLVAVRAPGLSDIAGQDVTVEVVGQLDGTRATLSRWEFTETVRSTGEVSFQVPLARFDAGAGRTVAFAPGFVRCDLSVRVRSAAREIRGDGTAYLPVRQAMALIVCGGGWGERRLLAPRCLDPESTAAAADEAARLETQGAALRTDRARLAARFEFVTTPEFDARLRSSDPLPFLVVLHECEPAFWRDSARLGWIEQAVAAGMHLLVVDPPPMPADPVLAGRLAKLLPALSATDDRLTDPAPLVGDRTMILNVVFDAGRWGRLEETPGKEGERHTLPGALDVQRAAAQSLIDHLTDASGRRMLLGRFEPDTAEGVRYRPHPGDRILVRIGPRLRADDALVDTVFAGAIELRVAALFAKHLNGLVPGLAGGRGDSTGIHPAPAVAEYPSGDPIFTPNQALIIFTGNVPQPGVDPAGRDDFPASVPYTLGGRIPARLAKAPPRDVLARLLLRGITTAVIRCDVPIYDQGLRDLTNPATWPGPGACPLVTFNLAPAQVLQATLGRVDRLAAGTWLTGAQAKARLLRAAAGDPFFGAIDLGARRPADAAQAIGRSLAAALRPVFESPRTMMAMDVTEHGRPIDGRVGTGRTTAELATAGTLPSAAPNRIRRLVPSPAWGPEARAVHAVAVEVGRAPGPGRIDPLPMIWGGVSGPSHVLCLGYSPFDTAESWWHLPDRICEPDVADRQADLFGPQRLIDLATLLARLEPTPRDRPRVRLVRQPDRRGGCELIVDFRPEHARDGALWQSSLTARGASPKELTLQAVNWTERSVTFRLPPKAAATWCGPAGREVEVVVAGRPDPGSRFYLPPPPGRDSDWLELSALESIDVLAGHLGGVVGTADDLEPLARPGRVPLLLALSAAGAGVALSRSRWRWLRWLRRDRRRWRDSSRSRRVDARGVAEEHGDRIAMPRGARRDPVDSRSPLGPGDRLEHVGRQSLGLFLVGVPHIPLVDRRRPFRATRLDLVVDLGESMRICRGRRGEALKVRLAGTVAQLLAELYWPAGAAVRLIGVGLAGSPRSSSPLLKSQHRDELIQLAEEWAGLPPDPAPSFPELEIAPATGVVWISDFLTGTTVSEHGADPGLAAMLRFGSSLADEGGWFAAIHISVPEEFEQIGLGFTRRPAAVLDRTGLTPADLRRATQQYVEELRCEFTQASLPFAAVGSDHDSPDLVEELHTSGLLEQAT